MIKRVLLLCFLATLMADEMLDLGLTLGGGLSAKNAYLYLLILLVLVEKAFHTDSTGLQLRSVHVLFVLLIADAVLSLLAVQFVLGYAGYELIEAVIAVKGELVDAYVVFLVFFYAAATRVAALSVARWMVGLIVVVNLVTVLDIYDAPDLGLIERSQGRLSGPLGQPNEYGAFLAFFIPVIFTMALAQHRLLPKLFFFAGCALSFGFLVQTVSRGSYAGLALGALGAIWLLRHGIRWKRLAGWTLMLAAVGTGVALVFAQEVIWELEERIVGRTISGDAFDATSGRTWIWAQALEFQLERPWSFVTGVGWDTYSLFNAFSAHNTYLDLLFNVGLVGLVLFCSLVAVLLRRAVGAYFAAQEPQDRLLLAGLIAGWCGVLVVLLSGTFSKPWLFVWAYTGLCMRIAHECAAASASEPAAAPAAMPGLIRARAQ
jgi:O-antigen ligase